MVMTWLRLQKCAPYFIYPPPIRLISHVFPFKFCSLYTSWHVSRYRRNFVDFLILHRRFSPLYKPPQQPMLDSIFSHQTPLHCLQCLLTNPKNRSRPSSWRTWPKSSSYKNWPCSHIHDEAKSHWHVFSSFSITCILQAPFQLLRQPPEKTPQRNECSQLLFGPSKILRKLRDLGKTEVCFALHFLLLFLQITGRRYRSRWRQRRLRVRRGFCKSNLLSGI